MKVAGYRRWAAGAGLAMAMLVTTVTAGCGGAPTSASGGGSSAGGPVTIEYWHVNSADWGGPATDEIVRRFNQSHPDIRVEAKFIPGNYKGIIENVQAAVAAGRPPAVIQVGYNFLDYVAQNLPHLPVEEAARRDTNDPDFLSNFLPQVLDLGRVGGKLEGMPFSISNPVLYYNADLFRQAGLDPDRPPATWEEVREYARIIKEKTGAYGFYMQQPPDFWIEQALIESNGARLLISENGKRETGIGSPEAIEAFRLYADMVLKDKTALHAKWEEGNQAFAAGRVGILITTIAKRSYFEENSTFDLRTAKFPTFGSKPRRVPAGGNALFILAQDPRQQEAAWEFIKYMVSPEALTIWVKGTGYLPPHKDATKEAYLGPFLRENPLMKPALEQLPDVVPWTSFPGESGLQIVEILLNTRDDILGGRREPEEALPDAARRINDLLSRTGQ
ncbi:ABC transporter substrate-binding protein [Thermaerobacter sp. PB12/4term]|uniref:ABC transporter substrate-binding protein n=1 Tax=Thermaerobacter sp. PB12/4term TaxID=2293838 RepID=UPI000E32948F|nr:ABC transporter substrate-binding protein [Thermaerobacter sp. PB12/4term]QIA27718.1 ABC transporter substrate-binding protein [Thermaerobacter sp. PB12/4term]